MWIASLYEAPRAVPVVRDVRKVGLRCLVNAAVLIMPLVRKQGDAPE